MSTEAPFRVLVLCAHNRTRSVMAGALLRAHLGDDGRFVVETAGFGPPDCAAIREAVTLLAERGIDVSDHRSRRVTPEMVRAADLVLVAEKAQVMAVVADLGGDFDKVFTLPVYVQRRAGERLQGMEYMRSTVPEVTDPTGRSPRTWNAVWADLDTWCRAAATQLQRQAVL